MKKLALAAALLACASPVQARTILFIGNSFTYGANSAVHYYKAGTAAAAKGASIADVIPLGLAFNRAMDTGVAGDNPYTGVPAGKINLWSWDSYHASAYGYYLEALMDFARVTGHDPQSLGDNETVADDLGFSKPQTHALQQIAHDELAAQGATH